MIIDTLPNDVVLTGIDVPVKASWLNYLTDLGTKGTCDITFNSSLADGDTITFKTIDTDLVFTCKTTPTNDFEIPPYTHGNQTEFVAMVQKIITNYMISQYYEFSLYPDVSADRLDLTSHGYEQEWWITDVIIVTAGTAPVVDVDLPTNHVYSVKYKFAVEVFGQIDYLATDRDKRDLLDRLTAVARVNGVDINKSEINIMNTLHSLARLKGVPLVYGAVENIVECSGSIMPFWLNIYEQYGEQLLQYIPNERPVVTTDYYFAIKSGIKNFDLTQAEFNQFYVDADEVRFLTQLPNGVMRVPKNMPNRLYFYNKDASSDFTIKGQFLLNDGTFSDWSYTIPVTGYTANTLYKVLAGYDEMGLDSQIPSGKHAIRYSVFVYDNTEAAPITEEFWFILENRHVDESNFFYFFNSLGGYDGIWLTGDLTLGLDHEKTSVINKDNIKQNIHRSKMYEYRVGTGLKYKDEIMALAGLINSSDVYWLSYGRIAPKKFVPVSFENNDVDDWVGSADFTKNIVLQFTDGVIR